MDTYRVARLRAPLVGALVLIAASAEFAPAQNSPDDAYWQGDPATPGDWFDADNWNPAAPGPASSAVIDNLGTAVISAGTAQSRSVRLGEISSGALRITGGSAAIQWSMSLGYERESNGRLDVSGGALVAENLNVGAGAGRGDVYQSAGEVTLGGLQLGDRGVDFSFHPDQYLPQHYGRGRYVLTGGTLRIDGALIGNAGVGAFQQLGGRVESEGNIHLGGAIPENWAVISPVSEQFETLNLPSQTAIQGIEPAASNVTSLSVWFPPPVPSRGRYDLEAGQLDAGVLMVDRTGTFRQTGGSSRFNFVAAQSGGRIVLRGGQLHAEAGFDSAEPINLGGRAATLSVGAGILNLSAGVTGARNARVVAGPDSLTILPAGFNPRTGFGAFNRQGIVHMAGNDLRLRAGKRIAGAGVIDDYVDAAGQIAAAPGFGINLANGVRLRHGAQVDLGAGGLAVAGRTAAFQGGTLKAKYLTVGGKLRDPWEPLFRPDYLYFSFNNYMPADSPGRVIHTAGKVEITQETGILSGMYRMTGGELDARSIDVGVMPFYPADQKRIHAGFIQTGGTVRTKHLALAQTYLYATNLLTNGLVQANSSTTLDAMGEGPAVWVPDPPPIVRDVILLGPPELHATYRLAGGQLIADDVYLSQSFGGGGGSTRFLQTGGSLVSSRGMSLRGDRTRYVMDGGSLTVRRLDIGAEFVLNDASYSVPDSGAIIVRNAASDIEIRGELLFGGGSHFRAVPGTTIRMTNPEPIEYDWRNPQASQFRNLSYNADDLAGLNNLTLVFDGMTGEASTLEVAGLDHGVTALGFRRNFALRTLQIGGDSPAMLKLVDLIDNQRDGLGNEALYVDTLVVNAGSTLDLGGLNLYYRHATINGAIFAANGSQLTAVPEPTAMALLVAALLGLVARVKARGACGP